VTQREELEEEDLGLMRNVAQREWLIDHACVIVLNGGSNSQVATHHNTLSICCCASEDWWVLILDFTENILEGSGDFGHCPFYI